MPDFNDPTPLYEQVERDIKSKIESGILKPGDQISSHHELTKQYNVSLITIKKALSNLVLKGILFTRVGKGTYVSNHQQQIKSRISNSKTIGLVLRDLKHPFFSLIAHSVEEKAYQLGYTILLSSSSGDIEKEESQINHFRNLGVDGLIIASLSLEYRANDFIQKLHNENFPYVMVSYMHDPDYWYVGTNHEFGSYLATEHLINLGYKSIGYLHLGKGNLLSEVRKNGYYRALTEYDMSFNSNKIFFTENETYDAGMDRFKLGYNFGLNFVSSKEKPEALVIYNDFVALGFIKACNDNMIKVPEDVAVVGFDDIELASHASVPLTTIKQDSQKIGHTAVEIIQKRIEKVDIGNRTILKPKLIIRESCGAKFRNKDLYISAKNSEKVY